MPIPRYRHYHALKAAVQMGLDGRKHITWIEAPPSHLTDPRPGHEGFTLCGMTYHAVNMANGTDRGRESDHPGAGPVCSECTALFKQKHFNNLVEVEADGI